MKQVLIFLFIAVNVMAFSQAPQSIPYQAVVRNTDGSLMASTSMSMIFKIHDVSATGAVVYEETHSATSNTQGLVSLNVGAGTPVTGTFASINWGSGAKFLQVLMNTGSGNVDLGTQQMMSVPYAMYADDVNVRVSNSGDSLFIGDQFSIVPGVSASNAPALISGCTDHFACNYNGNATSDDGSCLPQCGGCDDSNPSTVNDHVIWTGPGCQCQGIEYTQLFSQGSGVTDVDGNFYTSIIINGQEWIQTNLSVSHYSNGDAIETGLTSSQWLYTTNGAYAIFDDDMANNLTYGKLYNWYAAVDTRNLCPSGWHVPTSDEFTLLVNFLGGEDIAGEKMKSNLEVGGILASGAYLLGWNCDDRLVWHSNSSGFSALGGGMRDLGSYSYLNDTGFWWTSSLYADTDIALSFAVQAGNNIAVLPGYERSNGCSIRCIKD
jgi:uncharacterized protein (TIGR02145 family)